MFSVSFGTVDVGYVAMLQNKFSKDIVQNTLYYSGRYHIGLVSGFIVRPLQWKSVEFGSGNNSTPQPRPQNPKKKPKADSTSIISTTADAASITLSASLLYKIKFEELQELYLKWPEMSSHHRDVINEAKEQITSIINTYNYGSFITDRLNIQNKMGYQVGVRLKTNYFSEVLFGGNTK